MSRSVECLPGIGHGEPLSSAGIFEIMVIDDVIQALITTQAAVPEIKEQATKAGMWTLAVDGLEKILRGMTSPEEVLDVVFVNE